MKKILLLFSLILALFTNAQVSTYSFVQSTGTYTPLTGATVIATATSSNSLDDNIYPVALPFAFQFNGVNYNSINVSTNGFITFGAAAPGTTLYNPISAADAYAGAVSAWGRDLNSMFNVASTTGSISWAVVGTAPNREIVVQWANFRPAYSTGNPVYGFSFQIRLKETVNTISNVYGPGALLAGTGAISNTAQIGLRGATNTDYNNRSNGTTVLFSSSVTGTANTSTQAFNTVNATPGMAPDGLTYTWTPPSCFGPSGLVSAATSPTTGSIGWTAPTTPPGNGYEYVYNTTNTAPAITATGTPTTALAVPLGPLVSGTTYYWWVRSICSPTDKSAWVAGPSFTPGQIGGGTSSGGLLPINSCWGYNYSQQIYTAAEVSGAIGTNNLITKIRFFVSASVTPQNTFNQWVVYMGNTTQNSFTSNTNWVPLSGLQQVFSGTLPNMTSGQWVELTLANPFVWNGTSNIVVAVDENVPNYTCTQNWGNYPAGANKGILYYSDGTNPDPASPPSATSRYSDIPRLQIVAEVLQPCTTAPPSNIAVGQLTPTTATVTWLPSSGATYVVRYRIPPNGPWTTVTLTTPLTSNYTITGLTELTAYEVQVATICGGTQGAFSPSFPFTTPAISYCTASGNFADEFISRVAVSPTGLPQMISNSVIGTAAPYYSDYTNDPTRLVTLIRGTANNSIAVTRSWPGTIYDNATVVWIDWNRNGTFEDSERVLNQASNGNAVNTSAPFNVPTVAQGAYAGNLNLRMRVIIQEFSTPVACGSFSYGEVEDYSVKLIDLQPCSTVAPVPTVTNITSSSAYVSWLPTANATYRVRWREGTTGPWLPTPLGYIELPAGQSFYTIPNLLEQTAYQVQIQAMCGTTWGAFGASINFTTPPLTYCPMTGTGTNDHIANVTVTPTGQAIMSNTSTQSNYILYNTPATLINLEIGSTNNQISVGKAWANGTTYSDAVTAWIDYNRDGLFTDAERILISAASTTTPVTAVFNVPATGVYTGNLNTTMRVVLRRSSAPVMCQDPANGEVEDYYVRLRPCNNVAPAPPTFTTITQNSAVVNWVNTANNLNFVVQYRPVTTPVSPWINVNASTITGNPPLTLNGLTPATTYQVQISAVCNGIAGTPGAIRTFTTRCDPTPPNVTISNVTSGSATVTWNPIVPSATYIMRYRIVGTSQWIDVVLPAPPTNTYIIQGLSSYVTYEVQIANICVGETTPNPWSNPVVFTTVRVCSIPPPGLTITQLNPTSAEVTWEPYTGTGATNSYILRYRKVGIPSWTTINVNNANTYTINGLLELTKYEMQVANVCTGTPGNFTPLYYFTTPTVTYCQTGGTPGGPDYINKVTVTPYQGVAYANPSVNLGYQYYTNDPTNKEIVLVQGSQGNVVKIDKTSSSGSNTGVAVWIDFNRNGYFDVNEKILSNGPNTADTASASFTVPDDAFVSLTDYKYVMMRVAMQKDGIPVNCTNFANGEVEDYRVRIVKQAVVNPLNQTDIMIYPNPVSSVLLVRNTKGKRSNDLYYNVYNAAGQLVLQGLPNRVIKNAKNEIEIGVKNLINGVYTIDIHDGETSVQKKFIKE
ncbi:fibronectin type III domain-containing protein [Chryseobacterium caseinilyticum]|uniref:Fibronectin type III domain-containing protein n=1 Tax=Chryseobacterium caseinilyticum TaxID=2771428 RepID=A0ABR8ZH55_9FLAO|nr:fibronectin type III domain-containing protein [Chryseobacterium caseinilyticum]MBD8084537.1 fibronectin type III domain-containing protein [Chryseobacterium caseinilyticum]